MNYEKPVMEIIVLNEDDVITASADEPVAPGADTSSDWGALQ